MNIFTLTLQFPPLRYLSRSFRFSCDTLCLSLLFVPSLVCIVFHLSICAHARDRALSCHYRARPFVCGLVFPRLTALVSFSHEFCVARPLPRLFFSCLVSNSAVQSDDKHQREAADAVPFGVGSEIPTACPSRFKTLPFNFSLPYIVMTLSSHVVVVSALRARVVAGHRSACPSQTFPHFAVTWSW